MSCGNVVVPSPGESAPQTSWLSRDSKWFVPAITLAVFLLAAILAGGILGIVFGLIKSSEPYQHAVSLVDQDSRLTSILGSPIKPGLFVSGSINLQGSSGKADIVIPIK